MIRYNYSRRNKNTGEAITERDPMRYVRLQDPNSYTGRLGQQGSACFQNTDKVYNVN